MSVTKIRKSDPIRKRVTLNLTKAEWDFISERADDLSTSGQKVTEGLANVLEGNPFSERANEIRMREKRRRSRERRAS